MAVSRTATTDTAERSGLTELLKHIRMRKFHNRVLCGKVAIVDKDIGDLEGVYKDTKERHKSYHQAITAGNYSPYHTGA